MLASANACRHGRIFQRNLWCHHMWNTSETVLETNKLKRRRRPAGFFPFFDNRSRGDSNHCKNQRESRLNLRRVQCPETPITRFSGPAASPHSPSDIGRLRDPTLRDAAGYLKSDSMDAFFSTNYHLVHTLATGNGSNLSNLLRREMSRMLDENWFRWWPTSCDIDNQNEKKNAAIDLKDEMLT